MDKLPYFPDFDPSKGTIETWLSLFELHYTLAKIESAEDKLSTLSLCPMPFPSLTSDATYSNFAALLWKEFNPTNPALTALIILQHLEQGLCSLNELAQEAKHLSKLAFKGGSQETVENSCNLLPPDLR